MPRKREAMTKTKLRALLARNKLRQSDLAWIAGVGPRQARAWATGEYPIPQYVDLLLTAYDQGLLTDDWLIKHIPVPLP
jgi:hypothetical protein